MPTIPAIKPTDSADEARVKNNSAIARVNALDDTAENIAAFAASANAAAREAAGYRDDALEVLGDAEQVAAGAVEARDAAVQARVGAEQARGVATAARDTAVEAKDDAEAARGGAEAAQEAAETAQGAAEAAAGRAEAAEGLAIGHRDRAETAADRAEAAENSLLEWKGAWATARAYAPSDIVRAEGSAYVCLAAHTSGTFSTDRGAGKWEVFAQQGAPGPGSGDMLASVYDTEGREVDVYERGNHVGEQAISTVTGLQAALDSKSAAGHGHAISGVTGLQDALDAKAAKETYDPNNRASDVFNPDNHRDGTTWGRITKVARDWVNGVKDLIATISGVTRIYSPDKSHFWAVRDNGTLALIKASDGSVVPLGIGSGGTGATTHSVATANLFALSVEAAQSWTALQKRNGRKNLAAVGYEADSSITDAMKVAARGNIGAAPALVSGQTVFTHMGSGPVVLPAGGRWSYTYVRYASGASPNGAGAGSAAGGTQIAASGWNYSVLAIKETA